MVKGIERMQPDIEIAAEKPAPDMLKLRAIGECWTPEIGPDGLIATPPPVRWLFQDFLTEGVVACLYGIGGVSKSYTSLMAAVCLATRRALFDTFQPTRTGRTLYIATEDDKEDINRRLNYIARAMELTQVECEAVAESIYCLKLADSVLVRGMKDKAEGITGGAGPSLFALAELAYSFDLVVIDPITDHCTTDENLNADVIQAVNTLKDSLTSRGATLLYLHHSTKASANADAKANASHARGAAAWTTKPRIAWEMRPIEDGLSVLELTKANHMRIGRKLHLERNENGVPVRVPEERIPIPEKANGRAKPKADASFFQ